MPFCFFFLRPQTLAASVFTPNSWAHTSALIPVHWSGAAGFLGGSWKGPLKEVPDICSFNCLSSSCCPSPGLQREVDQLNAEIRKDSEEVNFLSTYMDHEYPIRLVQIANHVRQVQQAKDSQQVRELPPWPQYLD